MFVLLIFVSLVATFIGLITSNHQTNGFRIAFLKTSIIHGLIIVITIELLSWPKSLTYESLVFVWTVIAAINCGLAFFWVYKNRKRSNLSLYSIYQQVKENFQNQELANKVAVITIIIILSICLVTALVGPPNTVDSLTYHMPRVMYWIQNKSVAHYPTHDLRQIAYPPGAGYIITHLQILAGSDRFANCPQWWSFLGSIIGISLIAKNIAGIQSQVMTALICTTIPMAILQSSTTQTDLIVSFWLVCFAFFIFRTENYTLKDIFWLSASLGLAILTKPTAIIFGTPLLVVFGIRSLINRFKKINQFPKALLGSAIMGVTTLLLSLTLSSPFYYRNFQLFGNILGYSSDTRNQTIGLSPLISNLLRNIGSNVPFSFFWDWIDAIHTHVLNLEVNAREITFGTTFFSSAEAFKHLAPFEDMVGAPIHVGLFFIAILTLLVVLIFYKNHKLLGLLELTIGILAGFILFCLLLKWQPWGNRLLLPCLILSVPVIGYFVSYCCSIRIQQVLSVLLAFVAIIYSLTSIRSPVVSLTLSYKNQIVKLESILSVKREETYFIYKPNPYKYLTEVVNSILENKCDLIALDTTGNTREYLLWALLKSKGLEKNITIYHMNVKNESRKLESEYYHPDACLVIKKIPKK